MPQKADKTKSRVRYAQLDFIVAFTRRAELHKLSFGIGITFCLASVQKLFCLLVYVKSIVVRTKHQASLAYASKHYALTIT